MSLTDAVPSAAFDVLERNCKDLDSLINGDVAVVNRTGDTLTPIQTLLLNLGYIDKGSFSAGATLTAPNEILQSSGEFYRWTGSFPKVVGAGSSPTPSGVGGWVAIGDATLRAALEAANSTVLVGGKQAQYVGFGGEAYSRYKTTINFSLSDEDAEGLRTAMGNANKTNQTMYGRFKYVNGTASTTGVFDAANFGGQSSGTSAPIGFVFHHYTDGTEIQIDNVGEANKILVLKNAHNPTRRQDKASDFVGTGSYISFDRHNYALGYNQTLGFVDKDFKIVWTGVAGIGTLWQNKADDGVAAFRFQTTNAHVNILDILNGVLGQRSFTIRQDVSFTRTILRSETNQANGVGFEAMDGDVWLLSNGDANKRIKINKSIQATSGNTTLTAITNQAVETQVPFLLRGYNTASLPSASTFSGCMIRILDRANKPAYSDGTNWLFVATDAVVS